MNHAANRLALSPGDNAPVARHEVYQAPELQLDGRKIFVNVGVIKFQRRDDDFLRMVVQKFRRLVAKRGVVLVAFQDKVVAAAEAEAAAKVFSHSSNQKIGATSGVMQNPGKHGRSSGFSMRAGDHHRIATRQKEFFESLRQRPVRNFAIENRFHFRIAPRKRVAEDHDVRSRFEIGGVETVLPRDPEALQQR